MGAGRPVIDTRAGLLLAPCDISGIVAAAEPATGAALDSSRLDAARPKTVQPPTIVPTTFITIAISAQ